MKLFLFFYSNVIFLWSLDVGTRWNYISAHNRWPSFPGFSQMLLSGYLQSRSNQQYFPLNVDPKLPQSSPPSGSSPFQLSGSLLIQNFNLNERRMERVCCLNESLYIFERDVATGYANPSSSGDPSTHNHTPSVSESVRPIQNRSSSDLMICAVVSVRNVCAGKDGDNGTFLKNETTYLMY